MPRALVVHPGPNFSVADVHRGWVRGLNANGYDVAEYNLDNRLEFFSNAYLPQDDTFRLAFTQEQANWAATEQLKSVCYDWWPDVVVVISGFFMNEHLAKVIRERRHKLVWVMTESPYEDQRQAVQSEWGADLVVLNDPTNAGVYGAPTLYLPHSYDPAVHRPGMQAEQLRSDVCIVGTGYPSRVRFLEQIDWAGIDLALLGMWRALEGHPLGQYVRCPGGERAAEVMDLDDDPFEQCVDNDLTVRWYHSTKASINLYRREAQRPDLVDGWSMGPREVELAACGTFFVTEPRGENVQVLPEVPKFSTPGEAEELLRWYLAHDRARERVVRLAAQAVEGWTFERRVGHVLELLDRQPAPVG
jgi:spore maturation protein CgeB